MKKFLALRISGVEFVMLINVKMPLIVGILTIISRINFALSSVEHVQNFITSRPHHSSRSSSSKAITNLKFKKMFYNLGACYPGIQFRLPCTPPGQFFMGAKLFIGTPWMGNEGVLKKILVWAM